MKGLIFPAIISPFLSHIFMASVSFRPLPLSLSNKSIERGTEEGCCHCWNDIRQPKKAFLGIKETTIE